MDEPLSAAGLAGVLRERCRALFEGVTALQAVDEADLEEACARHLDEAGALRREVCSLLRALQSARSGDADLSSARDAAVRRSLGQCRGLLERIAARYGALSASTSALLAETRRRLEEAGRGTRVLRTYRKAARGTSAPATPRAGRAGPAAAR